MWLDKLKIALVEKNTQKLSELMDSLPKLETQEQMQEALHLIAQAKELLEGFKEETQKSMTQIQNNKNFLKSTQERAATKLDITS